MIPSRPRSRSSSRTGFGICPSFEATPSWESSMNERQIKALSYIQEHGRITNREYRNLCPDVSAETLRLDFVDLTNRGLLLKIGAKKGTYYILKKAPG